VTERAATGVRPRVSLVVCTRDRAATLLGLFESVRDVQPASGDELVVVDNGSSDGTAAAIAAFAPDAPLHTRIVSEPAAGLARARNRGVATARGEVIVFTDDDCRVPPAFLDIAARALALPGGLDYCGGRVLPADPADGEYGFVLDDMSHVIPPGAFLRAGRIQGACMAFRREVLERVGPFDEAFGAGTRWRCEDVDYLQRASLAGFTGGHVPELSVRHHHGRRPGPEIEALRRADDRARGAYHAKFALAGSRPHLGRVARSLRLRDERARREAFGGAGYVIWRAGARLRAR